jgi:hypothetical protein
VLYMESWFEDEDYYYIVLEICPHESLMELMAARQILTECVQYDPNRCSSSRSRRCSRRSRRCSRRSSSRHIGRS